MNNSAILLVLNLQNTYTENLKEEINEMILLANTLQYQIIETIIQNKSTIDSSTFFGKGKILEIKATVRQARVNLVIVDGLLSPKQGKNLEEAIKCMVWDRTQLILEVFSKNAKTAGSFAMTGSTCPPFFTSK